MTEWFTDLGAVPQAALAGGFTWLLTALGAALIFPFRGIRRALLDAMLGFAAGVMVAASVFSLLIPGLELAEELGTPPWLPAVAGFLAGGVVLRVGDRFLPHLHLGLPRDAAEGLETTWRRTTLLVLAITLHNVPEGLAVGVAFGAAASGDAPLGAAVALALGIAIQNVPEGIGVSMPLRREGVRPLRAFWYGQLSAVVEPAAPTTLVGFAVMMGLDVARG